MFAGATIVGLVLSLTVTVCVAVAVLPELSVTVQITVVVPSGKVPGALFVTEATPQLSAVVGVPSVTPNALHDEFALTVTLAGAVIVGFCVSLTVTVKLAVVAFPAPSVAVYVTVVVPSGKVAPELCVLVKTTPAQLSLAVGAVQVTTPLHEPTAFPITIFAGIPAIVGLVLSITVTTCVAVAILPAPSVAVQITVVLPSGKVAGALLVTVTVVQLSAATELPKLAITA